MSQMAELLGCDDVLAHSQNIELNIDGKKINKPLVAMMGHVDPTIHIETSYDLYNLFITFNDKVITNAQRRYKKEQQAAENKNLDNSRNSISSGRDSVRSL